MFWALTLFSSVTRMSPPLGFNSCGLISPSNSKSTEKNISRPHSSMLLSLQKGRVRFRSYFHSMGLIYGFDSAATSTAQWVRFHSHFALNGLDLWVRFRSYFNSSMGSIPQPLRTQWAWSMGSIPQLVQQLHGFEFAATDTSHSMGSFLNNLFLPVY